MTLPADKGISKNNDQYTNHYLECQQHVLTDTIQDSTVLNSNLKALMFLIHKDRYHHWRSWTRKHWAKSENESRRSGDQCFKSGPPTGEGGWILSVGSSSLSTSRNLSGPPPPRHWQWNNVIIGTEQTCLYTLIAAIINQVVKSGAMTACVSMRRACLAYTPKSSSKRTICRWRKAMVVNIFYSPGHGKDREILG